MPADRIDIIIPTHNGARTIGATIGAIAGQLAPDDRIHVVLNGCSDESAAAAVQALERLPAAGRRASILEAPHAGRSAALQTGDAIASGHRLYLDQDAVLSDGGLSLIRDAFRGGAAFVCGEAVWRTPSPLVAAAMGAWNRLPYVRQAKVTAGMYGVSRSGRSRWRDWPPDLPDDKWARLHFAPDERRRLPSLYYAVDAPKTFWGLVEIRRRYLRSNRSLRAREPELLRHDVRRFEGLIPFALDPRNAPGSLILAVAEIAAQLSSSPRR